MRADFILSSYYQTQTLEGCHNLPVEENSSVKAIFIAIAFFSSILSLFCAATIFYNKKLQAHPNYLIAYICISEAISCFNGLVWALNSQVVQCYFGFHYLFSWTFFFSSQCLDHKSNSLDILCVSNEIFFQFFQIMSLLLNLCLCLDLVLTLMNPFYPSKRRMKYYLSFSIIADIIIVAIVLLSQQQQGNDAGTNCKHFATFQALESEVTNMILSMLMSFYIIVALYSCVFALRRLLRPGVSKEIRSAFLFKHFFYVAAFIVIWTFFLASAYYHLFNAQAKQQEGHLVIDKISSIASFSTGIILTIIRVNEPYFKFLIGKKWREFFGIIVSEEEIQKNNKYLSDTLSTFLASSLNVELVNIILQGITKFTEHPINKHLENQKLDENTNHYEVQRLCKISKIEIDNADRWAVTKFNSDKSKQDKGIEDSTGIEKSDDGIVKSNKIIINEAVEILEYAPLIFMKIREQDKITNDEIKESLHPELNRDMVFKAGESQGKSGSFFFFSHDKKFLIKTMSDSELKTYMKLFEGYHTHIDKNRDSLLARIYGIFTVKMEDIVPVNLILMGNTVRVDNPKNIYKIFDLKGSIINREVKIDNKTKNSSTLKDVNLLKLCQDEFFLRFQREDRKRLIEIMEQDIQFLQKHGLMDYSLLLAVEKNSEREKLKSNRASILNQTQQNANTEEDKLNESILKILEQEDKRESKQSSLRTLINEQEQFQDVSTKNLRISYRSQLISQFQKTRHSFISMTGKYIYHIALIDYLQLFNTDKKMESRIKTMLLMRDYKLISAIDPKPYADRFIIFMKDKVLIDSKENAEDKAKLSFLRRQRSRRVELENE